MLPVATRSATFGLFAMQKDCGFAFGAEGVAGWAFTVVLVGEDIHPIAFFTVTLYKFGGRLLKMPVVLL